MSPSSRISFWAEEVCQAARSRTLWKPRDWAAPGQRGRRRVGLVEMLLDDLLQACRIAAAMDNDILAFVKKRQA